MAQKFLRKYGEAATVDFVLFKPDGVDFKADASFAAGDVTVMRDEGAEGNAANLPTDEGKGYSLVLSATEMEAARIVVYLVDQDATKAWLDDYLVIETYGDANAQHGFDLDAAEPQVNLSKWAGTSVGVGSVSGLPKVDAHALNDGLLSGFNAVVRLQNLHVSNPNGHGIESVGGQGHGIYGRTSGDPGDTYGGIVGQGGADYDSHGIWGISGQNGHGIFGKADVNSGGQAGIFGEGEDGIRGDGYSSGIRGNGTEGNADGMALNAASGGTGKDLNFVNDRCAIPSLGAQAAAEVNAEVSDVLKTDMIAELAQGKPTATPTFEQAIMRLYMALTNRLEVTSTFKKFFNSLGTVIWKKGLTDDGTTYAEDEGETGP
ncbi:MAG: hypothetical protein HUU32_12765 [Calditrichaceae bacterium]|nr:hypothetical protein [Calditrichaceae bacterium]